MICYVMRKNCMNCDKRKAVCGRWGGRGSSTFWLNSLGFILLIILNLNKRIKIKNISKFLCVYCKFWFLLKKMKQLKKLLKICIEKKMALSFNVLLMISNNLLVLTTRNFVFRIWINAVKVCSSKAWVSPETWATFVFCPPRYIIRCSPSKSVIAVCSSIKHPCCSYTRIRINWLATQKKIQKSWRKLLLKSMN